MILIAGAARVPDPASYDYSPVEEGLRHAGLVAVDLLRACLSSDVPAVVLGGHSFGIGAFGFHDFKSKWDEAAAIKTKQTDLALRQASHAMWRLAWRAWVLRSGRWWPTTLRIEAGLHRSHRNTSDISQLGRVVSLDVIGCGSFWQSRSRMSFKGWMSFL